MDLYLVEAVPGSATTSTVMRQTSKVSIRSFRPFGEPGYVPRDAYGVSALARKVGICSKDGIIILDPLNIGVVPDLSSENAKPALVILKSRLDGDKPLGLLKASAEELLIIYSSVGLYIDKTGVPRRSCELITWETPAVSYASRGNHLLLFSPRFIEIRDLNTGRIIQVIEGEDIRLLHSDGPTHAENETILVAMSGTKAGDIINDKIVELNETTEISSRPAAVAVPALWEEWDM